MHQLVNGVVFALSYSLKLLERHQAPQCERARNNVGLSLLYKLRGCIKVVRNVSLNDLMDFILNFFLGTTSLGLLHAAPEKLRRIIDDRVCIMACDGAAEV